MLIIFFYTSRWGDNIINYCSMDRLCMAFKSKHSCLLYLVTIWRCMSRNLVYFDIVRGGTSNFVNHRHLNGSTGVRVIKRTKPSLNDVMLLRTSETRPCPPDRGNRCVKRAEFAPSQKHWCVLIRKNKILEWARPLSTFNNNASFLPQHWSESNILMKEDNF